MAVMDCDRQINNRRRHNGFLFLALGTPVTGLIVGAGHDQGKAKFLIGRRLISRSRQNGGLPVSSFSVITR